MLETLQQLDQQLLLTLNGLHSPYWDSFMWLFTGRFIWIPMYATILYILCKNFNVYVTLLTAVAIALTITYADQLCATWIRPAVERLRPSNLNNPLSEFVHIVNGKRGGRVPFLSCLQFLRVSLLPAFFLQTTLVKYFHSMLGRPELLYPHLFRCTLPGRLIGRYVRRAEWCADLLLFTTLYPSPKENRRIIEIRRTQPLSDRTPERDRPYPPHDLYRIDYHRNHSDNLPSDHPAPIK